jgi:hypothetical protein
MDNLEGSVNGMVRYCIYKLSGNSSRNMFSNEFDCLTLLNSLLMSRKGNPSFIAVEPRALCVFGSQFYRLRFIGTCEERRQVLKRTIYSGCASLGQSVALSLP